MNTQPFSLSIFKQRAPWSFWIATLSIFMGLILSILSWLQICVEHCSANQAYVIFGFSFAHIGILFFAIVLILHLLSLFYPYLSKGVEWLIAMALGAEVVFIAIQKYQIGHWCPVCLSIAFCLFVTAGVFWVQNFKNLYISIQHNKEGIMTNIIKKTLGFFSFFILGFLFAFMGVEKINAAEVGVKNIKSRLALGKTDSQIEVYFVSDWFCGSCKAVEPIIQGIYPKLQSQAAIYFVDYPIHQQSMNFTPYNLAFLINDKKQYFTARQILTELASETETPNDKEVSQLARKKGLSFDELNFTDVKTGIAFFDSIIEKYKLNSTPTFIITNTKTHQTKILEGSNEITQAQILKAFQEVSSSK
jgi:uncharacterized membrane protein/thiol-disulfide isomerase/thioredoxin